MDANNNPTVQDVWTTVPAWSFPHVSSAVAPMPTAVPFIDQVYAQRVAGLSAYGFLDDTLYLEFGGYRRYRRTPCFIWASIPASKARSAALPLLAPRSRKNIGNHSWEAGTFGLAAPVLPLGLSEAGTDGFTDIGVDTQYQYLGDPHTITFRGAWIHENHSTNASQALGLADNANDQLESLNVSASYIYNHTWSLTAGRVSVGGTSDAALYGTATASPNSAGWIFELAYLPFSYGGPSFWPWLNFCIGLQYIHWTKFDGTTTDYNGLGRNANDDNTLFLYVWTVF